ncbi:hypothetical protein A2697_03035 [Candidatus Curtissbacteria bacterium RIFCSPHIGHO2_01_FULL_41_44]|uniref:Uncharacterized protein n=1 Tax=Candidatus Curtissbacteria bacterium RIFCSPLOWO2_01_FULL_42_50 TaxID=1797730 RepID=A0A1F5H4Y0_9BACT|nr:MAG: hypothetical protein A2697_03035 [Candidatus Curtissbacteria bacterium RIFCSPHIGHO2_01_FULL_41_44]OGD93856.1 MAG: hypothetical protein A3C33_01345 [Candidatus Curtissbacteria bacterium RIFCSPHIGHO2_02_FULL_42_58]OGD99119.1 MAG: hypothetical protein A3B54_02800 [Candidatus Curtissbacteria bacterium RIFCSPLOWO2_01_FULL_42_50]OGE09932.1 MAG: hypothetical protein A3H87_04585 [Candidatus Curtissbacteria bacterium RIFCSPLOWO2_02_FULL_42_37]
MESLYREIIEKIISAQSLIIGPYAVELANRVEGLKVADDGKVQELAGDGKKIVEALVLQYQSLFGRVSVHVCREATRGLSGKKTVDLPSNLK